MRKTLRTELEALTSEFARSIVQAIRDSSVAEILELASEGRSIRRGGAHAPGSITAVIKPERHDNPPGEPSVRLASYGRGTPGALRRADQLVEYVKMHPGLAQHEIREALGFKPSGWLTYSGHALAAGRLRKEGGRGHVTYWAV